MELLIDFRCNNQKLMRDEEALGKWMLEVVEEVGMTAFGDPRIENYPFPQQDSVALSATLFLGESSITIHTYPEYGAVFLNVFTCKDFDPDKALAFICQTFGVYAGWYYLFRRGVDIATGKPETLELLNSGELQG